MNNSFSGKFVSVLFGKEDAFDTLNVFWRWGQWHQIMYDLHSLAKLQVKANANVFARCCRSRRTKWDYCANDLREGKHYRCYELLCQLVPVTLLRRNHNKLLHWFVLYCFWIVKLSEIIWVDKINTDKNNYFYI